MPQTMSSWNLILISIPCQHAGAKNKSLKKCVAFCYFTQNIKLVYCFSSPWITLFKILSVFATFLNFFLRNSKLKKSLLTVNCSDLVQFFLEPTDSSLCHAHHPTPSLFLSASFYLNGCRKMWETAGKNGLSGLFVLVTSTMAGF